MRDRVRRGSCGISYLLVDEVAVETELADERVHLLQREWSRRAAFEVASKETVGGQAQLERGLGRLLRRGGSVLPRKREHAQQAPHSRLAVLAVDLLAQRAQMGPGVPRSLNCGWNAKLWTPRSKFSDCTLTFHDGALTSRYGVTVFPS